MNSTIKNKNKGFTLLELSVVLIVFGFMSVGFLTISKSMLDSSKISNTKSKMKEIDEAMKSYVLQYGRLPCPAGIKLDISNSSYGEEICKTENYSENDNNKGVRNIDSILVGTIPTKALNLDNSYSFDGWGDKFVYLVVKKYTGVENALYTNKAQNHELINEMFIYSVISNGRNQNNSYHYKSSTVRRVSKGEDEKNSYNGITGNKIINSYENNEVDDIIIFKSKENLIQQINKFDQPCSVNIQELMTLNNLTTSDCSFNDENYELKYRDKLFGIAIVNNSLLDDSGQIDRKTINQCIVECVDYGRAIIYNNKTVLYFKNQSSDN